MAAYDNENSLSYSDNEELAAAPAEAMPQPKPRGRGHATMIEAIKPRNFSPAHDTDNVFMRAVRAASEGARARYHHFHNHTADASPQGLVLGD